ncbi:hypothetical protein MMU07_15940 [Aquiflexum sp. LQ15W]|uniref:hypothetical protein n=1 Tax=Cognataquiflexum nitidum TaxID=2922272 RepID=UPI001F12EDFA|nr:hypothetical protein [Cognataquiflexum nitidum]MCH6201078.1 hypothetical protein [Cognataquiflexum nitidum]
MLFLAHLELRQSGLEVRENLFVKTLDPAVVLKNALPENEVIFYCKKGRIKE